MKVNNCVNCGNEPFSFEECSNKTLFVMECGCGNASCSFISVERSIEKWNDLNPSNEPVITVTTIPEDVISGEVDFEYFGGYIGL